MPLFKKPDGTFVDVPAEQSQAAVQRGYEPATEEQFQASQQTGRAGAEGLARGLTFGFGEDLITGFQAGQLEAQGLDPETAKQQAVEKVRTRKSENPKAAVAGELAGVMLPSIATGGGVSALAGGGLKGAAVEGGLMGLGQLVSESTLNQTPLDVEKAVVGMGLGALTSAGIAKGFDVLGKGVSAGMRKLGGSTLRDTLRNKADDLVLGALGLEDSPYRDAVLRVGREEGLLGIDAAKTAGSAKKARDAAEKMKDVILGQMDELESYVPLKGNKAIRDEMADYLESRLSKYANRPAYDDAVASMQKHIKSLRTKDRTWREAWELQSDLWKEGTPNTATAEAREELRRGLRDFVFDNIGSGKPFSPPAGAVPTSGGFVLPGGGFQSAPVGFGGALRESGQRSRALLSIADAFEKQAGGSAVDVAGQKLAGAGVGALVGYSVNPVAGVGAAVLNDQVRKRGGFVLGSVLRGIADSKVMDKVSGALAGRVKTLLMNAPDALGPARAAFEKAALMGDEAILETYLRVAGSEPDARTMNVLGLTDETPQEVEGVGRRVAAMKAVTDGAVDVDMLLEAGVDGFLGGKPGRPGRVTTPATEDLLQRMEGMRELLRDPSAAYQRLPPEILEGAPATAARLVNQMVTAARFLDAKAPKDPNLLMPESIRPMWKPSDADVKTWYRYAEAVENPTKVLERMSQGLFTKEHAEALKAVYPELYSDMSRRMVERLGTWEKKLPYEKKLMLSQFFGPEVLGVSYGQVMVMQGVYAKEKSVDAPASKGGTRPDGRQTIDAAKNEMTQAQRVEAR